MAVHIKELLEKFLKDNKSNTQQQKKIEEAVSGFLDEEEKKHIKLKNITKNQLVFISQAPSFTYNFNLKKDRILAEVKKISPKIESIKITIS